MNSENDRYWQELAEVDEREMVAMRQYYADLQHGPSDGQTSAPNVAVGVIFSILASFQVHRRTVTPTTRNHAATFPKAPATDVAHLTDTPTLSLRGRANTADTNTTTG
jgi:hypothetical protein